MIVLLRSKWLRSCHSSYRKNNSRHILLEFWLKTIAYLTVILKDLGCRFLRKTKEQSCFFLLMFETALAPLGLWVHDLEMGILLSGFSWCWMFLAHHQRYHRWFMVESTLRFGRFKHMCARFHWDSSWNQRRVKFLFVCFVSLSLFFCR